MTIESQNTEWKQSWQDEHIKCICGFANTDGGRMFIGKDDSGAVTGLPRAKKLLENLPNKIRDQLGLVPHINLLHEDDKAYLEIVVLPSPVPISFRGCYYRRSGSVTQALNGHVLTEFLLKKTGVTWDREIQARATLSDIDSETIVLFKKEAVTAGRLPDMSGLSTKDLLKKLNLLTEKGLTNAAIVLFGKNPGQFYPNLFVKIGRFGLTMVDMRFQEVCEGNLFQLLHDVMEQLEKKFLIKRIRFERLRRIEELEYPVPALREMLLNALVHRNYMGSMTQLRVMDNRLSLWNAGALPQELSVEKLFQEHRSIPRNPLIADVCYRVGYIDSWGRGIEKIIETCKEAGLPAPIIEENSGGLAVALLKVLTSKKLEPKLEKSYKKLESKLERLENTKAKILGEMQNNPKVTAIQLTKKLSISKIMVENTVKKLKKDGLVKRIGGPRGYWEVADNTAIALLKVLTSKKLEPKLEKSYKRLERLENTKAKILAEMQNNPKVTAIQLAKKLSISKIMVENTVKKLKKDGLVKRIGGPRGYWEVADNTAIALLKVLTSKKLEPKLEKSYKKLENTKAKILAEMQNNPKVTAIQLAKKLSISKIMVENTVKKLKKDGLVKRIGGPRGYWKVN